MVFWLRDWVWCNDIKMVGAMSEEKREKPSKSSESSPVGSSSIPINLALLIALLLLSGAAAKPVPVVPALAPYQRRRDEMAELPHSPQFLSSSPEVESLPPRPEPQGDVDSSPAKKTSSKKKLRRAKKKHKNKQPKASQAESSVEGSDETPSILESESYRDNPILNEVLDNRVPTVVSYFGQELEAFFKKDGQMLSPGRVLMHLKTIHETYAHKYDDYNYIFTREKHCKFLNNVISAVVKTYQMPLEVQVQMKDKPEAFVIHATEGADSEAGTVWAYYSGSHLYGLKKHSSDDQRTAITNACDRLFDVSQGLFTESMTENQLIHSFENVHFFIRPYARLPWLRDHIQDRYSDIFNRADIRGRLHFRPNIAEDGDSLVDLREATLRHSYNFKGVDPRDNHGVNLFDLIFKQISPTLFGRIYNSVPYVLGIVGSAGMMLQGIYECFFTKRATSAAAAEYKQGTGEEKRDRSGQGVSVGALPYDLTLGKPLRTINELEELEKFEKFVLEGEKQRELGRIKALGDKKRYDEEKKLEEDREQARLAASTKVQIQAQDPIPTDATRKKAKQERHEEKQAARLKQQTQGAALETVVLPAPKDERTSTEEVSADETEPESGLTGRQEDLVQPRGEEKDKSSEAQVLPTVSEYQEAVGAGSTPSALVREGPGIFSLVGLGGSGGAQNLAAATTTTVVTSRELLQGVAVAAAPIVPKPTSAPPAVASSQAGAVAGAGAEPLSFGPDFKMPERRDLAVAGSHRADQGSFWSHHRPSKEELMKAIIEHRKAVKRIFAKTVVASSPEEKKAVASVINNALSYNVYRIVNCMNMYNGVDLSSGSVTGRRNFLRHRNWFLSEQQRDDQAKKVLDELYVVSRGNKPILLEEVEAKSSRELRYDVVRGPGKITVGDRRSIAAIMSTPSADTDPMAEAEKIYEQFSLVMGAADVDQPFILAQSFINEINPIAAKVFAGYERTQEIPSTNSATLATQFPDEFAAMKHLFRMCAEVYGLCRSKKASNPAETTMLSFLAQCSGKYQVPTGHWLDDFGENFVNDFFSLWKELKPLVKAAPVLEQTSKAKLK